MRGKREKVRERKKYKNKRGRGERIRVSVFTPPFLVPPRLGKRQKRKINKRERREQSGMEN